MYVNNICVVSDFNTWISGQAALVGVPPTQNTATVIMSYNYTESSTKYIFQVQRMVKQVSLDATASNVFLRRKTAIEIVSFEQVVRFSFDFALHLLCPVRPKVFFIIRFDFF